MEPVQPGSAVAHVGTGLRYIGEHFFSYSGPVAVADSEVVLLEGSSGSGYVVGVWSTYYNTTTTDDYKFRLYFNEQVVAVIQWDQSEHPQGRNLNVSDILIPPQTIVKLTAENVADNTSNEVMASMVGRIYGTE